jgi:asparagine synthase (glutamine-hydrolysing)
MCGIGVAVDWPDAVEAVERLIEGIAHRGDVSDPVHSPAPGTAMGTRRLCIVDRERAVQPQASFDGRVLVSFNGEIYNYEELRMELAAFGVPFRTQSDTEVLANALRVWGQGALARISGMYAFVAFEPATGEFLAARDPFGIKPLYLIQSGNGFLFCSEIRPLLETAESGDVLLLPPGYLLTRTACARFPSPLRVPAAPWQSSDAKTLDQLLSNALCSHIPFDLPFAVKFSGGIDSTLLAHYARQIRPETPGYFVGSPTAPDYPFAAAYAETTGFDLRVVPLDPESDDVFSRLGEAVAASESFEPSLVRGALGSLAVSERIHTDGIRVALCGEGADELFCGYAPLEQAFDRDEDYGRRLREDCLGLMHRISLQRVDRCSMRHQIETRVPFLDPDIADYAMQLEAGSLVRCVNGRPVGKAALRDLYDLYPKELPRLIRDRTKLLFSEGSGLEVTSEDSVWKARFEEEISDRDFADGRREYAIFGLQSKEELYYLRLLSQAMDVFRIPHLRGRAWMSLQPDQPAERISA